MNRFTAAIIFLVALASLMPQNICAFEPIKTKTRSSIGDVKLLMTLKSDDVVIRRARGSEILPEEKTIAEPTEVKSGNDGKRSKHGGNRKFNRNQDFNHSNAGGAGARKAHLEKRLQSSDEQSLSGKRQQAQNRQRGNGHHKQQQQQQKQQLLKSQQHQEHQQQQQQQQTQENKRKLNQKNEEQEIGNSKSQSTCRYTKSPWSECDRKSNTHSRTLTLKKGDSNCLPTRTIQKKCKKSCRYEKGAWSECKDGEMTRIDKLKTPTDAAGSAGAAVNANCEPARTINRKCNPERNSRKSSKSQTNNNNGEKSNKKERKNKDKDAKHQPV